jgi:hypothetical protein
MGLLATSQFHFWFLRVEVSQDLVFIPIKWGREGSDLRGLVVFTFWSAMKNLCLHFGVCLLFSIQIWTCSSCSPFWFFLSPLPSRRCVGAHHRFIFPFAGFKSAPGRVPVWQSIFVFPFVGSSARADRVFPADFRFGAAVPRWIFLPVTCSAWADFWPLRRVARFAESYFPRSGFANYPREPSALVGVAPDPLHLRRSRLDPVPDRFFRPMPRTRFCIHVSLLVDFLLTLLTVVSKARSVCFQWSTWAVLSDLQKVNFGADFLWILVWIIAGSHPGLFLSYRIEKLEVSWFELLLCDDFLNTHVRCLMKCLWGNILSFDPIFIASLSRVRASTVSCFHWGS